MYEELYKKIFVAGILLILVGTCTISARVGKTSDIQTVQDNRNSGNTIYVDGANTEGPWDGTRDHPYRYIRDGLWNSSDRDTILVAYNTYFEKNLLVNKSVTLEGVPWSDGFPPTVKKPVIDANGIGSVLRLEADGTTISGFVIQHAGSGGSDAGIRIWGNFDNNTISDNEIRNCSATGTIFNNGASGNIVTRNIFRYNKYYGINCGSSAGMNIIYNNSFYKDAGYGTVYSSSSTGNTWNLHIGNWWSDYENRYPDAHGINDTGIWDTPYEIPGSTFEKDYRPLVSEFRESPVVTIIRPQPYGIYLFNHDFGFRFLNISKPFILFPITIRANASSNTTAIVKVEFYIDDELKNTSTVGENGTYSWFWNEFIFDFKDHTIKVKAYDLFGSTAEDQIIVRKFF
jgi:hypothetical protein